MRVSFRSGIITVGLRTVLARTCFKCDEFKPASDFPKTDRKYLESMCFKCHAIFSKKALNEYFDETIEKADKHRNAWTTEEQEFLEQTRDLPALEVALALGRTYYAVTCRRSLLKRDSDKEGEASKDDSIQQKISDLE